MAVRSISVPCIITLLCLTAPARAEQWQHDVHNEFPYAPARHMNAIGLPDDWHKPLITERGSLAYDFGPGPYATPLTEIGFRLKIGPDTVAAQWFDDPRTPIARTRIANGGDGLTIEAFTAIPPRGIAPPMRATHDRVRRLDGLNGTRYWASPPSGTDPAFRSVAWGTNRPICYRVRIPRGERRLIALGFCEAYKSTPRARLEQARVEGAPSLNVDPMPEGKRNTPVVHLFDAADTDKDGWIAIEVHALPETPDPNIILNAFWVFPAHAAVTAAGIISGAARPGAELIHECGSEWELWAPSRRKDIMVAQTTGNGQPVMTIRSRRQLTFDTPSGVVLSGDLPFILTEPRADRVTRTGDTLLLQFPRGTDRVTAVVCTGKPTTDHASSIPDVDDERSRAEQYWTAQCPVPAGVIRVPDARLQYLLETSARTIYQIRDRVDGGIQFQPGPTVYRGLWLGDVFLSGSVALMLGDTASVRAALEHGTKFQQPSGRFIVLRPSDALNETPVFVAMMCRYAEFARNDVWLREHWDVVRSGINWIDEVQRGTFDVPGAPYAGLMPPGFVDGGISHRTADYGTVWWALIALDHAIEAGRRLGYMRDAALWSALRRSMIDALHPAIRRDMRQDEHGRLYLPVAIGDTTSTIPPQRGQYAFLLPIPYAEIFYADDPDIELAVSSTLAMLDSTTREGIIAGSGWMQDGIWGWLGGIHSLAHLYRRNSARAFALLQAYADHASPLGTWVEEQQPRSVGTRTSGDMADAEAAAFYVQAVRSFIVRERGTTLHLLDGIPAAWVVPGAVTSVTEGGSLFGPVSISLEVANDGATATVHVGPVAARTGHDRVVLHLETLHALGFHSPAIRDTGSIELPAGRAATFTFVRER
jgi:hypothetical protein